MRKFCLSTAFIIYFLFFYHFVYSQDSVYSTYLLPKADTSLSASQIVNPYLFIDRYGVLESRDDSAYIYEMFSEWVFDELERIVESYQSFDDHRIHYSPRFDPLKKKDTTLIYLLDSGGVYAQPHPGHLVSRFGQRRRRYHYGVDLKLYTGDTVRSAFDGIVRISTYNRGGYGYLVIVRHNNGLETYYSHLSRLLVKPEDEVKAGDVIGLGGSTGRSTGPHLHWEIRYLGTPINPEKLVDFTNKRLISDTLYLSRALFSYISGGTGSGGASYHRIRSGETLSSIARRYGTSVSNLQRLNRMGRSTSIRAGNTIRVR